MSQAPLPRDLDNPAAIRASRAKLTMLSLRRLREELFRLQLQSIQDMIVGGVNVSKIAELSHCATAIAAIDMLQGTAHERQRS
jgi:hypothetical protein